MPPARRHPGIRRLICDVSRRGALEDFPGRASLNEAASLPTFLAGSNRYFFSALRCSTVLGVQKFVGCSAGGVVHSFLIALPRFYEASVSPFDALITILTTFDSPGVVLALTGSVIPMRQYLDQIKDASSAKQRASNRKTMAYHLT